MAAKILLKKEQIVKKVFLYTVAAMILFTSTGRAATYSSGPYEGKVVDAGTQRPIVGAVVLAIWYREAALFGGHGPAVDYHDSLEILTDTQGEFTIPEKAHFTLIGRIREPEIVVYYPGYAYYPSLQAWPQGEGVEAAYKQKRFLFALSKLITRQERMKLAGLPLGTGKVPENKMPTLIRLVNQELKNLGLPLIKGAEEKKP